MAETEQLSNLIGEIYDASLDPELWPSALEKCCRFVNGWSAGLFAQDTLSETGNAYYTWNISDDYVRLYFEKYLLLSPFMPSLLFFPVGDVIANEDLIPHTEFRTTRFYQEWVQPQSLLDSIASNVDKSPTSHAVFSIMRHVRNGTVDDQMRRQFGLLVPHVRRAVTIGKVIDLHKVEAAAMADTLDTIAAGMLLVDAAGRIVQANASGLAMLDHGKVIHGTGGKLTANDAAAQRTLLEILASAGAGDLAIGAQGIALPLRARDEARYVAHVLPLTSGARKKAGVAYSAVAAVFVRKAALELPHPLEAIAGAFKLTPSEMRVLMAIIQIGGVPEVAPVLGISETTVKTHLQHIFAKTNTARQADLVKLVAGYMSPMGSS